MTRTRRLAAAYIALAAAVAVLFALNLFWGCLLYTSDAADD